MKTTKNIVRIAATALAAMSFAAALSIPTFAATPELISRDTDDPVLQCIGCEADDLDETNSVTQSEMELIKRCYTYLMTVDYDVSGADPALSLSCKNILNELVDTKTGEWKKETDEFEVMEGLVYKVITYNDTDFHTGKTRGVYPYKVVDGDVDNNVFIGTVSCFMRDHIKKGNTLKKVGIGEENGYICLAIQYQ